MHSCRAIIDPDKMCGCSWLGRLSCPEARSAKSHEFPLDVVGGAVEWWSWGLSLHPLSFHDTVFERVGRCTWRPWSSKFGDALRSPRPSEFGDAPGIRNRFRLKYVEVVDLAVVEWEGGTLGAWGSIHWLTLSQRNVESWVQQSLLRNERWVMRDWLGAGESWSWGDAVLSVCSILCTSYSVYAFLGVCSTRCMQYSAYAGLGVCSTWCMQYLVYAVLGVCSTRCMQYVVYAVFGVVSAGWMP